MKALIGSTGFIGRNLTSQIDFEEKYNSKNIASISGKSFELIICAGAPGSMFFANRFPKSDKKSINFLLENLSKVKTKTFVLISSIAVLDNYESAFNEGKINLNPPTAYGQNRLKLEEFVAKNFDNHLIVRLPSLFGKELKKNFLYDILNPIPTFLTSKNYHIFVEKINENFMSDIYDFNKKLSVFFLNKKKLLETGNKEKIEIILHKNNLSSYSFFSKKSQFQFYNLQNLSIDLDLCMQNKLNLMHLVTEPLIAGDIYKSIKQQKMPNVENKIHLENVHTNYSKIWNSKNNYIQNSDKVLEEIIKFSKLQPL